MVSFQILKIGVPARFVPGVNVTAYLDPNTVWLLQFSSACEIVSKISLIIRGCKDLDSIPWKATNFLVNLFGEKAEVLLQTFFQVS